MIKALRKWTMKHCYTCTHLSDRAKLREFKYDKLPTLPIVSDDQVWKLPGN